MRYKCPRCKYNTDQRGNMVRHIEKIKICKDKVGRGIIPTTNNIIYLEDEIFTCEFCDKEFTSNKYLIYHKKICKPKNDLLKKENNELKQQLANLALLVPLSTAPTAPINYIHNGDIVHNGDININIYLPNNFNESNLSSITPEFAINNMRLYANSAIANIVDKVHFDPERPENHNVCISDKSRDNGIILENGKWLSKKGKDLIEEIYDKYYLKFIYEFSEDPLIQELYPDVENLHNNYLRRTNGHIQNSYEAIREVMYNKKDLCLENKKQMENQKKLL